VCNGCPVRFECLEEAYEISEPFGVWGGMNEVERKRNLVLAE
jgi:WhiB family redox-sensing transcriptional regulator